MSALGKALRVHGEAVDQVEALYLEHAGECTEETTKAEALRDMATDDALERLARFRAWVSDDQRAIAAEYERLAKLAAEYASRAAWADGLIAGLVRARDPGAKTRRAGLHTIKLRDYTSVKATPELDFGMLPKRWIREVAAVPAKPAALALDKAAAKKDLRAGWQTGEPPGPGWYDARGEMAALFGPARVYLWKDASGGWRCGTRHQDQSTRSDPFPKGTEWRHHAPGVELASRVSVTIV